jgi:hypothetical protein
MWEQWHKEHTVKSASFRKQLKVLGREKCELDGGLTRVVTTYETVIHTF